MPQNFIGLPETVNVRTHRMSIADAIAPLADGINGCAFRGGTDATDAFHEIRLVNQGSNAARGPHAHLICSSKSLLREETSMAKAHRHKKTGAGPVFA